ncbi:MAG: site-specific integrase [Armatimonadetes bacterium]|nr:site-specific integrase [Armatimonadota bacterium]
MAGRKRHPKGLGSTFQRGGVWIAQVMIGYHENGKPKYRQVRCKDAKSQDEAVVTLRELMIEQSKGVLDVKGRHTVASWLDCWLEDHIKPNREPKTHYFYSLMAEKKIKPFIGRLELKKVTPDNVNQLFKSLAKDGATPNTIAAVRRTLRAAFGVAIKYSYCNDNPVSRTFAVKVRREPKVYFDAEQIQKLLIALKGSPIENLVLFTLATGARIGEVTGITWDKVDLNRNTVFISHQLQRIGKKLSLKELKTEKSVRTMPLVGHSLEAVLAERARLAVETHENELNLVFTNPWGRAFDPKFVNKELHRMLEVAGLPKAGMHSFRHSAATFLLMSGANLHQVSRYLGHSQIALTSNLYGHVLDGAMKETAEKLQESYHLESKFS